MVVVPYVIMAVVSVAVSYAMQALAKPINIQGAKLGDMASQTSKEGGPRIIAWGIVRPIGGNIVACSDPKTLLQSLLGKGGDSTSPSGAAYRTYAIGICEGPVTGIRRVWRNNKLVYDAREGSTWGPINNGTFLAKAKFYLGDYDQLPSPVLEGIFGVGNVPAMRGTCYMVMKNEDLADLGGAVPQYLYEVVRAEGIVAV